MPSVAPPLPDLVLFARPGCDLCEEARGVIGLVLADRRTRGLPVPQLVERNIELDPGLHRAYLERIPVLELGRQRIELVVSIGKLRRMLAEELDDEPDGAGVAPA